jgi:hypothetical protein
MQYLLTIFLILVTAILIFCGISVIIDACIACPATASELGYTMYRYTLTEGCQVMSSDGNWYNINTIVP